MNRCKEGARTWAVGDDVRSNADLTQAAAGGMRWLTYARVATELVMLGSMVVLARLIPPAAFGVFAVVMTIQELAFAMPMEGVGGALVQREEVDRDHLSGGFALNIGISILVAGVTALAAIFIIEPLFNRETALLSIAATPFFFLGAVYAIPAAVLRRRLDFYRLSIIEISQSATRSLAALALALVGFDAPALVFGGMAGMAMALGLALLFAPVPLPRWRPRAIRDLLPYGGPAALATVAWTGFRNGDYLIIGSVLGPAQAGFYWRGYQLAVEYQTKVTAVMTQVSFPVLARTTDAKELLVLRQRMVQLLLVVVFPLLAILLLVAPVLVPWLFGSNWEPAVLPAQILVVGGAAMVAINATGSTLMAEGRARTLLGYGVAHFVVYVGAVLAVAHLGLAAVAIAGSVVHTIFLAVAYVVLLRGHVSSPLRVLWQDLAPATTACAALLAIAGLVDLGLAAVDAPAFVQIAGVGLAGALAYLIALRFWFPDSARDLGSAIRRILPSRFVPARMFALAGL